jgi:hypothetical protein
MVSRVIFACRALPSCSSDAATISIMRAFSASCTSTSAPLAKRTMFCTFLVSPLITAARPL